MGSNLDQYSLDDSEAVIELREAWRHALTRMAGHVPESTIRRFIQPLTPVSWEDDVVVFRAPGQFVQEWVKERLLKQLEQYLGDELGMDVRMVLDAEAREKPTAFAATAATATVAAIPAPPAAVERGRFVPRQQFRFDTFVVGQSNRLAVAGAKAVAASPGNKYNPLFIYGSSGLGKTHLLHSIANEILGRDRNFPLAYVPAQQFAEEFVHALQTNRIDQFRRSQRDVNVWLVDDIQFIAGKDKTQEEIFHTFNYLQTSGKQIVLCSDRPPRDLLLMDERLRSRFEAGLVADVQMPDTETRCAIIQSKAEHERVALDHSVAMFLAESVPGNVRILEGALTKLAAQASLEGQQISLELAQRMVERYYRSVGAAKPGFEQILEAVSKHYSIPVDQIQGISRKAPIAHARHVAVYVTREITGDSWKHIGALFGNRDHTSMMHAYTKIRTMLNRDKDLNAAVKTLIRDLYPEV